MREKRAIAFETLDDMGFFGPSAEPISPVLRRNSPDCFETPSYQQRAFLRAAGRYGGLETGTTQNACAFWVPKPPSGGQGARTLRISAHFASGFAENYGFCRSELLQEVAEERVPLLGTLDVREVARALDDLAASAGQRPGIGLGHHHEAGDVHLAGDDEGRDIELS